MSMIRSLNRTACLGSLLISLCAPLAMADEATLYGPVAPECSAFVRGYNAASETLDAQLGSLHFSDIAPKGSSDYEFLPAGSYKASAGGHSLAVSLAEDQYYTLVRLPGGDLRLIDEPLFKNRQKSLLRLQNLTDSTLSLKTADGKTEVIKAVAGQARGEREINPVKVRLALFAGERKVGDLSPLVIERGEVVSLYVTGAADKLSPVWVKRPVTTD